MGISVGYGKRDATDRHRSPRLWGRLPVQKWFFGEDSGFFFYDDFLVTHGTGNSADSGTTRQYQSYIDTGVTMEGIATIAGGVMRCTQDGTDNDEGSIATNGGGSTGAANMCVFDTDTPNIIAFECRVKKSSVADNQHAFFIGLAEENLANADTLIDDTGEIASKDMIGFRVLQDNGEEIDFVYRKAGQAVVELAANCATMAADTWIRLGFLFNPFDHPDSKKIKIFINGTEYTTYGTNSILDDATFPDDQELGLLWANKIGTAAASTMDLDWWAVGGSL